MPYSNGLISAPVSIKDVQRALGVSSSDLGTLCKHANINKWARYKPQRSSNKFFLEHGTMLAQTGTRKGGLFGLEIPYCSTAVMNDLVYQILDDQYQTGWSHLKPRGQRSPSQQEPNPQPEYFRLADFAHLPSSIDEADPTPVALTGYNRNAPMPFEVILNADLNSYEINKQETSQLIVKFRNTYGNDLHLQDFVKVSGSSVTDNDYAWRPVLQVFKDAISSDSDYPAHWYERSQPFIEVAGQAITNVAGAEFQVSLNISDTEFFPFSTNPPSDISIYKYYLCIGVGYCKAKSALSGSIDWKQGETDLLFIIPYEQSLLYEGVYPFIYEFHVTKHQSRHLRVNSISFHGPSQWETASKSDNVFTIHSEAQQLLRLTMEIEELPNQSLDFISQNGTWDSSQADSYMKVQAREMIGYVETSPIPYLTPQTSGWSNPTSHIIVPTGSQWFTLYATLYIGNIPVNGYGEYHMFADTGGQTMNEIGYFSIHKVQYT